MAVAVAVALQQRRLPHLAAAILDGIAAVPRRADPQPVWTAPNVPGLEGRTTLAVADLINRATSTVYAATDSAGAGSEYVQALANAIERGVSVTVVLDRMQTKQGDILPEGWPARGCGGVPTESHRDGHPSKHAKVVVETRYDHECSSTTDPAHRFV